MNPIELARWQWQDYASFHQDPVSLRLHLVSVPLFWAALASIASWPWHRSWLWLALGVALIPAALGLQSLGHKREAQAPKPFTSALNAITRLLMEQLFTFPRYVLSGQAWRALQGRSAQKNTP